MIRAWLVLAAITTSGAAAPAAAGGPRHEPEFAVPRQATATPVPTPAVLSAVLDGRPVTRRGTWIGGEPYLPLRDLEGPFGFSSRLDPGGRSVVLTRHRPSPTVAPQTVAAGTWARGEEVALRVMRTEERDTVGTAYPAEGMKFYAIVVQIQNRKKETSDVLMMRGTYAVKDASGASYSFRSQPPLLAAVAPGGTTEVGLMGEVPALLEPEELLVRLPGERSDAAIRVRLR